MTDISALTGSSSETTTAKRSLADSFDTFLTMLTTQLENQDPLSPLDSTEFTNQIVQFSGLEQQIASNEKLDNLFSASKAVEAATAVQYLGKTVEIIRNVAFLNEGSATISYALPGAASEASVTIHDQSGNVVRTLDAKTTAGRTDLTWDGKDGQGIQMDDGTYTIVVSAKNQNGNAIEDISAFARGTAKEIINDGGETFVVVNDVPVLLGDVKSITPAAS